MSKKFKINVNKKIVTFWAILKLKDSNIIDFVLLD